MPVILFVCTANRSRSPIAAACFRRELASHGMLDGWRVFSAGTWTTDGLPPAADAIASARRLGLDLSDHVSKVITPASIQAADVIVVMEQGQKEAILSEYPAAGGKVHLLSEVATGASYEVPDPISPVSAAEIHAEIADLVKKGFHRIRALAGA
ncbi:MAG: hypothetical protein V1755_03215 [Chloroflexota bacterium]